MSDVLRSIGNAAQRVFGFIVLFAALRILVGIVFIFLDGGVAHSLELTLICAVAVVVYVGVALAVRRWSPAGSAS
jgi:hypothetical protein